MTGGLVMVTPHVLNFILNLCESVCQPPLSPPIPPSLAYMYVEFGHIVGIKSFSFLVPIDFLIKHSLAYP